MQRTKWCVYRHTTPDGRKYIGIAQQPAKTRWANGKGYKCNKNFWECIQKIGWENIKHEILYSDIEDRFEALRIERRLINDEGTLWPNGFNRSVGNPEYNRIKHKRELGDVYGHCTVIDYWPDEDRRKIYYMKCERGKKFTVRGRDITYYLSCGCKGKRKEAPQ